MIWEEALSVWATWTVPPTPAAGVNRNLLLTRNPRMDLVGPGPYLVGRSGREARHVMEKLCLRLTRGSPATPSTGLPWIEPNKTVVCLGDHMQAAGALASFCKATVSKLKHIVLVSDLVHFHKIRWLCKHLYSYCPTLETLIIDQTRSDSPQDCPANTYYVYIPTDTGPELGRSFMDYPYTDPGGHLLQPASQVTSARRPDREDGRLRPEHAIELWRHRGPMPLVATTSRQFQQGLPTSTMFVGLGPSWQEARG